MEEKWMQSEPYDIYLQKIHSNKKILDVGGGGEGIIGKIYGNAVVAIDKLKSELDEVSNDALNIVMDGRQMGFVDESFEVVTCFYTLFYMEYEDKKSVLKECFRVLDHGGVLEIWDSDIPKPEAGKDAYITNLNIHLDNQTIKTGYGTRFKAGHHFDKVIYDLCISLGFRPIMRESRDGHFHMKFVKYQPIIGKLRDKLLAYDAVNEKEIEDKALMLDFVDSYKHHFSRNNAYGHFTGSSWVLNQDHTKVLLTHHKKLDMWLQLGGHVDPGESVAVAALREAKEESGLENIMLMDDAIYDLDAHLIPSREDMPEHYHFDIRFCFIADDREPIDVSFESNDLKWINLDDVRDFNNEASIKRMVDKVKGLLE